MNKKIFIGPLIVGLIQLIFIMLKCLGVITCPWPTVLTPLLTCAVVAIMIIFFLWICKE